jgi:hypothetical protein
MCAVAERLVVGALAAAQVERAGVIDDEAQGLDAGAVVRPVAERLLLRASAATIEVRFALGELDLIGPLLGDDRFVPIFDVNNVFQEQGSLTWTRGAHNIKMGAGLIRRQVNYYQNTFGLGYFRFTQDERTDLVNFIQGKPDQIQRQVNPKRQYFRFWEPNIYVQDDWHAKSWLTLNLGLRWDHFSPITASQGERSSWDPALAGKCTPAACNPFNVGATAGVKSYWTNFEPRLGFAATPRQGLVVRGGVGLSRFAQDYASGSMNLYNPPFIPLNLDCNTLTGVGNSENHFVFADPANHDVHCIIRNK